MHFFFLSLMAMTLVLQAAVAAPRTDPDQADPARWRAEHRFIDLHQHIECAPERLERAVSIMDAVGIGIAVNLSGGAVTSKDGALSDFATRKAMTDRLYPGRFLHYMNLDYARWDEPDFPAQAVQQVEDGHRLGAAGLKEFKRLGLYLRDKAGKLIRIDDPKLDGVWQRCGELNMPVSIHVADPKAFWLPYNEQNERWTELKDHKNWWFGDPAVYPRHEELLAALNRVIQRHPKTTFVCVHFANNAEDLKWVEESLDRYPNMNADLAARIPEIGRQAPEAVRALFLKHQDRIFFGTDFQVYERLTLGSGGSGPAPTDRDAVAFYQKHWRWLETSDRNFSHMTPIQGDWTISAINLPSRVLRRIYFDNARKLLARSLPAPMVKAAHITSDFELSGELSHRHWKKAAPAWLEYQSDDYTARPELGTSVRVLWSDRYLYLGYEAPFTVLTYFDPAELKQERMGLWDRDVVEAFIGADPSHLDHYSEYEVAPNGEKLDLLIHPPKKDFEWSSGWETAVTVDNRRAVWRVEMRIPLAALSKSKPAAGMRWRVNLYRCDKAHNAYLAWNPTLTKSFHEPPRFGWLEFAGATP